MPALPMGGEFLKQVLDKGPVVVILMGIIFIGYKRYNKMTEGFVADMEKFMNSMDNRITGMDTKLNKILKKLAVEED